MREKSFAVLKLSMNFWVLEFLKWTTNMRKITKFYAFKSIDFIYSVRVFRKIRDKPINESGIGSSPFGRDTIWCRWSRLFKYRAKKWQKGNGNA